MKRIILIVLDSVGIGELPDAAAYGDAGSNTLLNIKKQYPALQLPHLTAMGLAGIDGAAALADHHIANPIGSFGKLAEASKGKDTTTGHWEIAGLLIDRAFPVYPHGFPQEIIKAFETKTGHKVIGNCPASGTAIIQVLGDEHVATGNLIVYTSADSVFQIAAHEDVIPIEEQYRICQIARDLLTGEHNVSRVITRPFIGQNGQYERTRNRKDFSLEPIGPTMLDAVKASGLPVAAVGKIEDIFAGCGITEAVHTQNNMDGVDQTLAYMRSIPNGLILTNLVDFDMLYGHRNDVEGYAKALMDFDRRLPEIVNAMGDEDILMITADHGCDPTTESTDHSREYIPLLIYGKPVRPGINLHIRNSFADIGATVLDYFHITRSIHGESFLREVLQ